ncbi:hypothetical protein [Serratia ficaria]|uniref:hypothetical protein n=1 Tax=Serratia ficaria TaxID=61651 RepID=UPI00077C6B63|nr:hypothetical protein [Serratia ficaria]
MSVDISSLYRPAQGWNGAPAADDEVWTPPSADERTGGAVQFSAPFAGGSVNFGAPSSNSAASPDGGSDASSGNDETLSKLINALLSQVLTRLIQGQNGEHAPPSSTSPTPEPSAPSKDAPPSSASLPPESSAPTEDASPSSGANGPSAGDGPRTFNITNTQDHDICIGQFDQHNQLVGELRLKPGESGQMHYQNDFTGLLKQADADGNYQDSASRLEFYNGFVNTSDIDGRNAAIYATDHQGFEIGDQQSIADHAPVGIVTQDSAGNKTIAGYYDGSTDTMRQGGQFMTDTLGTGMTYMHPDDDRLPQGQNPMRHTDAMTLDVTFGKA